MNRGKIVRLIEKEILQNEPNEVLFIGASYKKNVGDIRESPSLKIIKEVHQKQKVKIYVLDPHIDKVDFPFSPSEVTFTNSLNTIKSIPKLCFVMVDHDSVREGIGALNLTSRVLNLTSNS